MGPVGQTLSADDADAAAAGQFSERKIAAEVKFQRKLKTFSGQTDGQYLSRSTALVA